MPGKITPEEIIGFWYSAEMRQRWFSSTPELDADIRNRYESLWASAARGELDEWKSGPEGCLALIIVLDQFPLNMFRGEAKSFQTEHQAIEATKYALAKGYNKVLPAEQLAFLYMPLMHSENLEDQDLSVKLFAEARLESNLRFAQHHRELIRKFSRFPHRNAILGRESTPAEIEYLQSKEAFLG
ncbi:MAG: DUF924 domain-containing protein [Sulfuricella sp.]|nr:DUF924 domain-containing protein [Sulfuricella sp.]